jgi:hypothetical protein
MLQTRQVFPLFITCPEEIKNIFYVLRWRSLKKSQMLYPIGRRMWKTISRRYLINE